MKDVVMETMGNPSADETKAAARAVELRTQLAAAQTQLTTFEREQADEEHDAGLGAHGAAERAADARQRAARQRSEIDGLSRSLQEADGEFARLNNARMERIRMQRLRTIPTLASQARAQAAAIEAAMAEVGRQINKLSVTNAALAAAIDTTEARRLLGDGALKHRLQHCLVNDFYKDDRRNEALRAYGGPEILHWFDWPVNKASPDCKVKFSVATDAAMDTLDLVFSTEKDARQVRDRIDPSGTQVHPQKMPEGLWRLIRSALRGAAARAPGAGKLGAA